MRHLPALRPSLWQRVLRALRIVEPTADNFVVGSGFGQDYAGEPGFDSNLAMSAGRVNAWYFTAANKVAPDLASLPLVVCKRNPDGTKTRLAHHPFLDLLETPSPGMTGELLRRQLVYDWKTEGNAYLLELAGPPSMPVVGLLRLHPARTRIVPDKAGNATAYKYDPDGGAVYYSPDTVHHLRGISTQSDTSGVYGQGLVEALALELQTDSAAAEAAAKASKKGRPDFLVTPSDAADRWDQTIVDALTQQINKMLGWAFGGALVLGGNAKYTPLSWAPKDLEYAEQRTRARDAILAAWGVPPSKAGVPSSNYATARQEEVGYWGGDRKADARLLDAFFTQALRRFDRNATAQRLYCEHDFAGVTALQYDRTERLARVDVWVNKLGADPDEAAAYEGFVDAPALEYIEPAMPVFGPAAGDPAADPAADPTADPSAGAPSSDSTDYGDPAADGGADPEDGSHPGRALLARRGAPASSRPLAQVLRLETRSMSRGEIWKGIVGEVLDPQTRKLTSSLSGFFEEQAQRYTSRLVDVFGETRSVTLGNTVLRMEASGSLLNVLAKQEELDRLLQAFGPELRDAMRAAFEREAERIGVRAPGWNPATAKGLVSKTVVYTQDFTDRIVHDVVMQGMTEGLSTDAIAERVLNAQCFRPVRAARVAQTSATAAASKAADVAAQEAIAAGVDLRGKSWLSVRDDAVRDTHEAMDGQLVPIGGLFRSPSGATGPGPGQMSRADENYNCRCLAINEVR